MEAELERTSSLELILHNGPVSALLFLLLIGIVGLFSLRCLVFQSAKRPFDCKDVLLIGFFFINASLSFVVLAVDEIAVVAATGAFGGGCRGPNYILDQALLFYKIHLVAFLIILTAFAVRSIRSERAKVRESVNVGEEESDQA